MFSWYGEALGSYASGLEFKYNREASKAKTGADLASADIILDNAKARLNAAGREANLYRHKSKVNQSDAVAAMAGQGTTTDIMDLAQIKAKGDYNAIAALFEGTYQAADMRTRGMRMKADARQNQYQRSRAAAVGAWGNLLQTGYRAFGGGGFDFSSKPKIPSSGNKNWGPLD